ncbi:DUF4652 domain-containing protein [Bacillus cereus]|uniref:DUF4652 domain-containing protein n=1 Tax=Bacillus cereus TaxID=1396 RepID=UPI0011A9EA3C|nr:DUF4652 domain-containing protein [Bacillus cereus]
MFNIRFDSKTETVQLVYPNEKIEILADNAPTEPVLSPDNTKAVYISPLEWEVFGSVYLVNLEDGTQEVIVEPENSYIPKNVIWYDNDHILVIIGYGQGTVSVGGNIFAVNVKTKVKTQITKYENDVQVTDLFIEGEHLKYIGIKYIDEMLNESRIYENTMSLKSIKFKMLF